MYGSLRWSLVVLGLAVVAAPAAAQRRVAVRGPKGNVRVVHPVRRAFREGDRGVFRGWFREHRLVVTPLRPEIARLVVRGKPLPVGVVRVALARELLVLVPSPAPGYEYAIVGNRIVMIDDAGLVADILEDIFP